MTDYNDGKWHGWNGGECPVHRKTMVQAMEENGARWTAEADDCDWPLMRGAFRVVKEYREPREFWICTHDWTAWGSKKNAEHHANMAGRIIRASEVIE